MFSREKEEGRGAERRLGVDDVAAPQLEEASMLRKSLKALALIAISSCGMGAYASLGAAQAADQAPPIGGGYFGSPNVIAIPVNDPAVKSIAGALYKPAGAGPFPAVIYMSGCAGLSVSPDMALQKKVIDHLTTKGVATLVVDPFTPRQEMQGVCAKIDEKTFVQLGSRGGDDAWAAVDVLKAMPDIDPNRVFLQGYSWGAISSLFAVDTKNPVKHDIKIAGVIAYYPFCYDGVDPSVATLVLIGDKDDWTPAAACQAVKGKPNVEVVVYPGDTHAFVMPGVDGEFMGHHFAYDEKAAQDAQQRADAFMAAHMK
jgi:dienelactone hydrolase